MAKLLRPRSSVVEREIPALWCVLKAIRSIRVGVIVFLFRLPSRRPSLPRPIPVLTVSIRKMGLGCRLDILTLLRSFEARQHSYGST